MCYLMILLIIGSSTEPAFFHAGCRPSHHVGLLQHLYLTYSSEWPTQHLHLTYSSERHALTSELVGTKSYILARMAPSPKLSYLVIDQVPPFPEWHSALTSDMEGTNPLTMTEWLSPYI